MSIIYEPGPQGPGVTYTGERQSISHRAYVNHQADMRIHFKKAVFAALVVGVSGYLYDRISTAKNAELVPGERAIEISAPERQAPEKRPSFTGRAIEVIFAKEQPVP